jgi:hypothetical protein
MSSGPFEAVTPDTKADGLGIGIFSEGGVSSGKKLLRFVAFGDGAGGVRRPGEGMLITSVDFFFSSFAGDKVTTALGADGAAVGVEALDKAPKVPVVENRTSI